MNHRAHLERPLQGRFAVGAQVSNLRVHEDLAGSRRRLDICASGAESWMRTNVSGGRLRLDSPRLYLYLVHTKMDSTPQVKCPTCKKTGAWFDGAYGPFCSHRCKLIDLGKWFNQEHAVSEPLRPEHLEKFAELPPGEHLDQPDARE